MAAFALLTLANGLDAQAQARLDALEKRFSGWTHTLAGRQEWSVLDAWMKERRKTAQELAAR